VGSKAPVSAAADAFADLLVLGAFALGAVALLGVGVVLVRVRRERGVARFLAEAPAESAAPSAVGLSSDEGGETSIKGMPWRRVGVEVSVVPGG